MAEAEQPYERLSAGTENYLLSLYKLWEDSEVPTITQLTDTLKRLPSTEGLGTSVPSVAGMIRECSGRLWLTSVKTSASG